MRSDTLMIEEGTITVELYLEMRASVGWKPLTREQAKKALDNSLCTMCVTLEGKPVGMARLVGDGSVICYVQDLIVRPSAQGKGVGSLLMTSLVKRVEEMTLDGTEMMMDLMCAKGREKFYADHGFIARPTIDLGPGMIRYIRKKGDDR